MGSLVSILGLKFMKKSKKSVSRGIQKYFLFEIDFSLILLPFWTEGNLDRVRREFGQGPFRGLSGPQKLVFR